MGLQAASTSVSSSSASKNVILKENYIGQENLIGSLDIIKNCIIQKEEKNLNILSIKKITKTATTTTYDNSTNTRGKILKKKKKKKKNQQKVVVVQHIKDLKLLSNVSVQSNMAPALTEPLSPANKISTSKTSSASPRSISNNQFATINGSNRYLSLSSSSSSSGTEQNFQNFYGDTNNLIDIETELLKIKIEGDTNGVNNFYSVNNTISEIHKNQKIYKGDNIKFSKGAFQSVFEEVIAKQKEKAEAKAEAEAEAEAENRTLPKVSTDCISALSDIKQSKNYKLRQTIEKKTNRFLTIPLKRLNISREKFSRQMGPMCDTNNLSKSTEQLDITGGSGDIQNQQETDTQTVVPKNNNHNTSGDSVGGDSGGGADSGEIPEQQIKAKESEEHMDLSNYDNNEDSQQGNSQVEINSSSSTVTADNTDAEGKFYFFLIIT